jgi:hypothetical protein
MAETAEADVADRKGGSSIVEGCTGGGTCLGLLLLHVGPNGDGFGGQAFMENYTACA